MLILVSSNQSARADTSSGGEDAKVSGLHIAPCVVPGSEHAAGLELSYRW